MRGRVTQSNSGGIPARQYDQPQPPIRRAAAPPPRTAIAPPPVQPAPEPTPDPNPAMGDRSTETGRPYTRQQVVDPSIAEALGKFSDKFHQYRRGSRNSNKINPLYDLRKDPITRFTDFLDSDWNTFPSEAEALRYAEQVFEGQGDDIAGQWRKD